MLIKTGPSDGGYFIIDQRAAGIPVFGGNSPLFEADTYTCTHCNAVVILNLARTRERYRCSGCSHHICDNCAAKRVAGGPCVTMAQLADEIRNQRASGSSPIILP